MIMKPPPRGVETSSRHRLRGLTQNPSRTSAQHRKNTSPRHAEPPRMSPEMSVPSAGMPVMEQSRAPAYRLVRRPLAGAGPGPAGGPDAPQGPPRLDQAQQQVVEHKGGDRKSTRLNSSHMSISYAVFCLKKKKKICK